MKTRILVLGAVAFFSLNSAFADLSVPASTLSCVPPPSGLVGWWPAGGSANDVIGGDNGTLEGGATFAAGEVGQGFRFDGTNGFVQIPDADALKPTNVTVEAWVWLDPSLPSGRGGEQIVFKKNTWSAWFEGYSLLKGTIDNGDGTYSDRFQFCISRYGDQVAINSQTIAQRGVWYHVAATYDGNRSVLYVNGVAEASATPGFALDYDSTPVFIGTSGTWPPYLSMFGGIIDEVSIYNRALSSNDIAAIYRTGSAGKCQPSPSSCVPAPSDMVSWWRAEGNANDSVGTNHGTPVGGVSYTNGEVGQAFRLDGTSGYVHVPASGSLNVGTNSGFTIEGWINPSDVSDQHPLVEYEFDGVQSGVHLWLTSGGVGSLFANIVDVNNGAHFIVSAPGIVQTGVFQHVALTYDKTTGTASLYYNGSVVVTSHLGIFTPKTTTDLLLGRRIDASPAGYYYSGILDEISLYKRALSSNEIAAIYNAGNAGKCSSPPLCVPPPLNLVSWWRAEGNANDSVGTNHGTLVAGITFTGGKVGQAFHLDGTDQYVQIADSPSLKPANVSVEAWVKLDTLVTPGANIPGQQIIVFKKNTRSGNFEGYTLLKDRVSGQDCFSFAIASAGGLQVHALSSTIPQVGTWYHLVGTYDGATVRLYVNGVMEGNAYAGFPLDYGTRPVFFGRTGEFWVANFGGSMDEVSIYNRALTADEIQALDTAGSAGKCPPLVAPIILVQPQGQTVNAGDTATFSVLAEGLPPLYYQWFFNSNLLTGATSPTLTLTNTRPDQGGLYSVVVSNPSGVAVSSNALLHVNQIPVADASATASRVFVCTCLGTNAAVVLNGTRSYDLDGDPLQYFWLAEGVSTPLATGAIAVVRLPPGTYPMELVVSDGLAADTNLVVVKVLTASQAIEDLIGVIDGSGIAHPKPLIASLMAASDSVARCNPVAAVNQLEAFQHKVLAQIARDDTALAGILSASAQEIIDSLDNCGGGRGRKCGKITAHHGQQDGKVHLEFEGSRGQNYLIEASSDLANWVKIGVAKDLHNGNFEFEDSDLNGAPMRFYRVVSP
jgi:Concanavalin A-like lectin/glucanases superfamily/Immunoglobulin domain